MLTPGQSLQITVTAEVDGIVDDAVVGIGIDSTLGQVVFGTNTKMMGIKLPRLSGSESFTFRLPELWLGEGQYFVHAALARDGGVELHRLSNAASLAVHAEGRAIGFVSTRTELLDVRAPSVELGVTKQSIGVHDRGCAR